jgi:hypothetical protein
MGRLSYTQSNVDRNVVMRRILVYIHTHIHTHTYIYACANTHILIIN